MLYMVTFTINIPPMLAYIPYMDPMGYISCWNQPSSHFWKMTYRSTVNIIQKVTCPPEEGDTSCFTLWLFNIAMENGPFIDGLSIKNGGSFHGKLLVITRW